MPFNDSAYFGFNRACWVDRYGAPVPVGFPFNPYDRLWRIKAAEILSRMYSDPALAETVLADYIGGSYSIVRRDNDAGLFTGWMIAWNPRNAVIFVSGTSTPWQFAVQAFEGLSPPTNYGNYSTWPLWNANALNVAAAISVTGMSPVDVIAVVGHSYGAATTQILSGLISRAFPARPVFQLTFGCPPPGLLAAPPRYLRRIVAADIINVGDPIAVLPPPDPFLEWLKPIAGQTTVDFWRQWKPSYGILRMERNGTINYDDSPTVDFATMVFYATQAVGGVPLTIAPDHAMDEYYARLLIP